MMMMGKRLALCWWMDNCQCLDRQWRSIVHTVDGLVGWLHLDQNSALQRKEL